MVNGNVKVMSEMLTELVPSQAENSDLELLQVRNRRQCCWAEGWHMELNLGVTGGAEKLLMTGMGGNRSGQFSVGLIGV